MNVINPFKKLKFDNYFFPVAGLGLAVLALVLVFIVRWPLGFAVCGVAMFVNLGIEPVSPEISDTRPVAAIKRIIFWLSSVGCSVAFVFNWLSMDPEGRILFINWPIEEYSVSSMIVAGICCLIYFVTLFSFSLPEHRRLQRQGATVKMKGVDGNMYLMPGTPDAGWRLYWSLDGLNLGIDNYQMVGDTAVVKPLLIQRLADLTYEQFLHNQFQLTDKPLNIDTKKWGKGKLYDPEKLWATFSYAFQVSTARYMEERGRQDEAMKYMDQGADILRERYRYVDRHQILDAEKTAEKIYNAHTENTRYAGEAAFTNALSSAKRAQAAVEKETREYEAGAADRRAELEDQYYREQERARRKEQLRAEYEEKLKQVDDKFNALASAQDGTLYSAWHDSSFSGSNTDADTYRRREFLRSEEKDKYRREYEDALRELEQEDEE